MLIENNQNIEVVIEQSNNRLITNEKKLKIRIIKDKMFKYTTVAGALIVTLLLAYIIFYIAKKGISSINWTFITELPKPPGEFGGGVSNAIVGTLIMIAIAAIIAVPVAIAIGVYLSEDKKTKLSYWVRTGLEILQGMPSISIGIVVYVWVVLQMGSFSALSGGIALAIMMLPVVAKSTEETLKMVPYSLKEASMALGVPYYKTLLKVVIPSGLSGILTGILIAIARVAGETAPLLFTSFGNPFMNANVLKPMNSLPLVIFNYASSPYKEWHSLAWGASFLLIVMILILNITAKIISRKWKIKF
ncbi:MAG: phosphate ABC transporter permease PstA [Ignavibacteriae bacterium]|nr:phosphate ABC transporter permease PstA [Ignavibacteriota bacterium]